MQPATLDPLTDVTPLIDMALAAEARLRPLILNPPADESDSAPALNRLALILGRMISMRKALLQLRDCPMLAGPRVRRPRAADRVNEDADTCPETEFEIETVAATIALTHELIDALETTQPAAATDLHGGKMDGPESEFLADQNHIGPKSSPLASKPAFPPEPRMIAIVPNPPPITEANVEKLTRALNGIAAEASRALPAVNRSPYGYDDIAVSLGPIKLSPALLKQLRPPPLGDDSS